MELAAWGKFESPDRFHRLEHHCADVAACFEALVRDPLLRDRFEPSADPDYIDRARERAEKAVRQKGFRRADRPTHARPADFTSLFG